MCRAQPLSRDWTGAGDKTWASKRSLRSQMARASSHPGWYRKAERALKTAQRRVSRRKRGEQSQTQGRDVAGEGASDGAAANAQTFTTRRRSRSFSSTTSIYHENLAARQHGGEESPLWRNHQRRGVGRLPHHPDAQSSMRRSQDHRRQLSRTPRSTCSGCGMLVSKGLSVRWHSCPDCALRALHQDHNAAKNIERLGQSLRGGVALAAS